MQVAFENAMKEHNTYLKESDKMFLSQMKEEGAKEQELQKEELAAYKDSMALLANAIGGHSLFNNHIIMFTMILTVNKHFISFNFIVNKY